MDPSELPAAARSCATALCHPSLRGFSIRQAIGKAFKFDQIVLNSSFSPADHMVDECSASGVLAELASKPAEFRTAPLQRRLFVMTTVVEAAADAGPPRATPSPDRIHHMLGMAFQQRAKYQQLVLSSMLRLGLHGSHQPRMPDGLISERWRCVHGCG